MPNICAPSSSISFSPNLSKDLCYTIFLDWTGNVNECHALAGLLLPSSPLPPAARLVSLKAICSCADCCKLFRGLCLQGSVGCFWPSSLASSLGLPGPSGPATRTSVGASYYMNSLLLNAGP